MPAMTQAVQISPFLDRQQWRHRVADFASGQCGVVGRRQLIEHGVTRWQIRSETQAGRWQRLGRQTLSLHTGPLAQTALWWQAVLEVGPHAVLDGVTALQAAGLRGIDADYVHVAVPKSSRPLRCRGVIVHETRRYSPEDVVPVGIPRTRPAVAAIHAALWARSDRQAALFPAAAAQQRIVHGEALVEAVLRIRRHPRRRLLLAVVQDVLDGAQSLGELDFARVCRQAGLPEPTRQVVRRLPSGRVYLDVAWERWGVFLEINGVQHLDAAAAIPDALKLNAVTLKRGKVLHIPVLALRVDPAPFLGQIEEALRAGGWAGQATRTRSNSGALLTTVREVPLLFSIATS
jgi:hypothetical protein